MIPDPVRHRRLVAGLRRKYCAGTGVAVVDVVGLVEDAAPAAILGIKKAADNDAKTLAALIDSRGGFVDEGFQIADEISRFKGRTIGIVVGKCDSAANIVLASCVVRVAAVTSKFLIHSTGIDRSRSDLTLREIDNLRSRLRGYDRRCRSFFSTRISSEFAALDGDGRDHTLTARQAERLGLLTAVAWEATLCPRRLNILSEASNLAACRQRQIDLRARLARAGRF